MVNILSPINKGFEKYFTRMWDFTWRVPDCEELVGQSAYCEYIFNSFSRITPAPLSVGKFLLKCCTHLLACSSSLHW